MTCASDERAAADAMTVLTIGHSTRSIEEFIRLLLAHKVRCLVDVRRTVPRSRRNPQFERETLSASLEAAGINYWHLKALGGLRKPLTDSPNTGWRNTSFRGFADYMQSSEFEAALERLIQRARDERSAIMCAEAVPWRCHRSLVADALLARDTRVEHIMTESRRDPHKLTAFARRTGVCITYPPEDSQTTML